MDNDFLTYVSDNYNDIKAIAKSYSNYDEDVFQQTIINCSNVIEKTSVVFSDNNQKLRYFLGAYKMNLLRDKLYYCNKNVDKIDDIEGFNPSENINEIEDSAQISMIKENVCAKFGQHLTDLYFIYCASGESIANLQKRFNIKNLKQRLRDIRNYITQTFKEK